MSTATAPPPAAELTVLNRLGSIPLVSSSLSTLHTQLTGNRLTASPYAVATHASAYAYGTASKVSAPLLPRLAPLVARADGLANAAVDVVQARVPYAFTATPDDITRDLTTHSNNARDVAHKTIDDRVRSPAGRVAQDIDARFTPLVDYLELAARKLGASAPAGRPRAASASSSSSSSSDEAHAAVEPKEYQYQRALGLTFSLRDSLYAQSAQQARTLQEHNVLVQKAAETAHRLGGVAGAANARVHQLSDVMIAELVSVKEAGQALPAHLQASFHTINKELSSAITDLSTIIGDKNIPAGEKVTRVRTTVQQRVQPLLEATTAKLYDVLGALSVRREKSNKKVAETYANGTTEAREAFQALAERAGIKVEQAKGAATNGAAHVEEKESEIAQEAREHKEEVEAKGVTYAEVAKEEVHGEAH